VKTGIHFRSGSSLLWDSPLDAVVKDLQLAIIKVWKNGLSLSSINVVAIHKVNIFGWITHEKHMSKWWGK
jgi:hypothetical protein